MRRVLAPAFSADSTKRLTPIFLEKSCELSRRLVELVRSNEKMEREEGKGGADVEIMVWLSRATLDIIGLAGEFSHRVELSPRDEPRSLTFRRVLSSRQGSTTTSTLFRIRRTSFNELSSRCSRLRTRCRR